MTDNSNGYTGAESARAPENKTMSDLRHSSADLASAYAGRLGEKLAMFGLDVQAPLALRWYNDALPADCGARIPEHGDIGPDTFALLIGNTKHIWDPFITACACHEQLMALDDPLDTYIERSMEAVLGDVLPQNNCRVYYAHRKSPDMPSGGYVALQRMAQAIGLAYLDSASHLCLHPKYGSWFSLRCVVVFDGLCFTGEKPPQLPNPLDATTRQYINLAVSSAMHDSSVASLAAAAVQSTSSATNGMADTEQQHQNGSGNSSHNGSQNSSQTGNSAAAPSAEAARARWQKWVAVRDAPCAGHPWRFSKHQIMYHYTSDREVLRKLVALAASPRDAPERLAVELELPSAAARRRSREAAHRSFSGELPQSSLGSGGGFDPAARWAAYTSGDGGSTASAPSAGPSSNAAAASENPSDWSPARRRSVPGLRDASPPLVEHSPASSVHDDDGEDASERQHLAWDSRRSDSKHGVSNLSPVAERAKQANGA